MTDRTATTPLGAAPAPGWRLLPLELGTAPELLERGLALLDGLTTDPRPTLRGYRTTATTIVVGRGQRLDSAAGLPVVRRHSGGGAVLLDETVLCLDVLLPAGHAWLDGDVATVFLHVGRAWAAALADLGVAGLRVHEGAGTARRLGSDRERLLAAVCYATPGRGEVLHDGRKLVGLAQRRRRSGALVQCGLLRRWRPATLLDALGADPGDAELTACAVGLDDLVDDPPDDDAVLAAVAARMAQDLQG